MTHSSSGIPIEIVTEEEMALIEAALAATRSSPSSSSPSLFRENARSLRSITALSKRRLSMSPPPSFSGSCCPDIEDSGPHKKKSRPPESLLLRFRRSRALSVTDFTSSEWCEKQFEFHLRFGKRRANKAMKAGSARHLKLEEEAFKLVVKKVKVTVESYEDQWALKFLNFVTGALQKVSPWWEKLMKFGCLKGKLIRTQCSWTLKHELQLMVYKYLWDSLVAGNFQARKFFDYFNLNPYHILTEEIRENFAKAGLQAKTLDDIIRFYVNTFGMLPPADNQLLLRYEFQKDNSIIGEDQFMYDPDWLESQIQGSFQFWRGEREAYYAAEEERWKCRYCQFASVCPINANSETSSNKAETSEDISPCFKMVRVKNLLSRSVQLTRNFCCAPPPPSIPKIGDVLRQSRVFSLEDVTEYSKVSHDSNPLHFDPESARNAGFEAPLVHGMLVAALFPRIISSHFPGTVYASQSLHFKAPVYIGDEVVGEVQAISIRQNKNRHIVKFATKCFKNDKLLVIDGEAMAILPTSAVEKVDSADC
ncbi:hypothetical protein Tsubulata_041383 [Turnera subulata]|uniref:MaoC-like domain-containing protein n=1 Tax=Turnera subulata TaxID=218843 RepID=A0A9Q0FUB3_9ROSI|nr:hypothetical protein Tsubulata_041383 [Turnera subulata]